MGRKLPKEEQGQYSFRTLESELELLGNKGEKSASVRNKDVDSTQGLRDRNCPQERGLLGRQCPQRKSWYFSK